jgi:indolepyruvate ferredoxin oxidoreductase beta subunit
MSKPELSLPKQTGWRILLAGTGGQGVITAARLLSEFFVQRGHQVVSGQLHGMAQRGGAVQSTVSVDRGISPALPRGSVDLVLGLEPVETVRALPYLSPTAVVFMNMVPVTPFVLAQNYVLEQGVVKYPPIADLAASIRAITPRLHTADFSALAIEAGSVKTLNVVLLGCLFGSGLLPYQPDDFMNSVMRSVPPRLASVNHRAFRSGVEFGQSLDLVQESSCL